MSVIRRVVKPKTQRGKRALQKRAPKVVENTKRCLVLKGPKGSDIINHIIKDIHSLKRPNSLLMQKKNDIRPFENYAPLEQMAAKNDCSLFIYGSHSKKRPENLILGRFYNGSLLDMVEFAVSDPKLLSEFKGEKISVGTKPILIFSGPEFLQRADLQRVQNLLADVFRGPTVDSVNLIGLEHALAFTAQENTLHVRSYRVSTETVANSDSPRVKLDEIGPRFEMQIRRTHFASESLYKTALKTPKDLRPKKVKNINEDTLGTTYGRIHIQPQNINKIQTRKMKGLKRTKAERISARGAKARKSKSEAKSWTVSENNKE